MEGNHFKPLCRHFSGGSRTGNGVQCTDTDLRPGLARIHTLTHTYALVLHFSYLWPAHSKYLTKLIIHKPRGRQNVNVCTHVVCLCALLPGQCGLGEDSHREHALFSLSRSTAHSRRCHRRASEAGRRARRTRTQRCC